MRHCGVAIAVALGCGPAIGAGGSGGTSSTSTSSPSPSTTSTSTSTSTSDESTTTVDRRDLGAWPPGFITDPDGQVLVDCSLWDQNCPPGEKCMPWSGNDDPSWNATRCSPIAPDPQQPGEPCTVQGDGFSGLDDCAIASMCWSVDPETSMGYCVAFCVGSENNPICFEPDHHCSINGEGTIILCIPNCNPLAQDCPEGEGCWGGSEAFSCAPDASGDVGAAGDPCEYINVCDPGLHCALPEYVPGCQSSGCCTPYCDLQTPDCMDGQECLPYFDAGEAPPAYENVGICGVAQ